MPYATASRVRAYLDDLDRALSDLPKDRRTEIVRDIRGHIDVALAERGQLSAADVEQVLEELGTLLFPGGLLTPLFGLLIAGFAATSSESCVTGPVRLGSAASAVATRCSHSGSGNGTTVVVVLILIVIVVGPIFSAIWLMRTARRVS